MAILKIIRPESIRLQMQLKLIQIFHFNIFVALLFPYRGRVVRGVFVFLSSLIILWRHDLALRFRLILRNYFDLIMNLELFIRSIVPLFLLLSELVRFDPMRCIQLDAQFKIDDAFLFVVVVRRRLVILLLHRGVLDLICESLVLLPALKNYDVWIALVSQVCNLCQIIVETI